MDVATLEQAIKKVMRTMLDERDTLVHCKQDKHRSGSFVIFLYALINDGIDVEVRIDEYLRHDPHIRPHDFGCTMRVWRESGLWSLLDATRGDLEVQRLVADIHARLDESNGQGVDGVKA